MIEQKYHPISIVLIVALVIIAFSTCTPSNSFPLSQSKNRQFGTKLEYDFIDPSRDNRPVNITVWYPAIIPEDAPYSDNNYDAQPDLSGVPYPLILSSAKTGSIFGPHLATYGFVVVGVKGQDSWDHWGPCLIDYPRDLLFALDQVANTPLEGLEGMIDSDHAGVMGYSFDSFTSLVLSGARIDPQYYLAQCAGASSITPPLPEWWVDYACNFTGGWDEFVSLAGPEINTSTDGLWQSLTDSRILAAMPLAPEGAWIFGERGLAAVNRPVLIIGASDDDINLYDVEVPFIFEHLGTSQKVLITFVGDDHLMIFSQEPVARMKHFAVAFFGYYLQGKEQYASYFNEKFVSRRDGLAWGIFMEK